MMKKKCYSAFSIAALTVGVGVLAHHGSVWSLANVGGLMLWQNPNDEIRNPKEFRSPKPEARPKIEVFGTDHRKRWLPPVTPGGEGYLPARLRSDLGKFRNSDFWLLSAFGIRHSALGVPDTTGDRGEPSASAATPPAASPYQKWSHGPSTDLGFFPLAVWLQNPAKAEQYRDAGINTYVGLWRGPAEEQLAALKRAGLKVICHQNEAGRRHLDEPTIIGWMHGDEPDNAQSLGRGKGYGPPILPGKIVQDYEKMRAADPSRPIFLNLGQGVAYDNYIGRGVRRNHPEDYPEYVKGGDIVSFDIYPAVHEKSEVAGKLWFVAQGVERLVKWGGSERIAWNCLECTRIHNPEKKATPHQVRCEAWMSIIHGSRGLIYFVHEWEPKFNESALLSDPEMLAAVTALNRQITSLARVINSPTLDGVATVQSANPEVPIALLTKRHENAIYLFAVGMREGATRATFTVRDLPGAKNVTVIDESRSLAAENGVFSDTFKPWDVHIYRIPQGSPR